MAYIKFDGKLQICFANMRPEHVKMETQINGMTIAEATEWLTQLAKELPFKWEIYDGWVRWERPEPYDKYGFGIFHGNLVKGVNEFSWFAKKHIKDKSKKPFLVKNWEAFKSTPKALGYNANHYPFPYESDGYPLKVETFKEAMDLLIKKDPKPGYIWRTLQKDV